MSAEVIPFAGRFKALEPAESHFGCEARCVGCGKHAVFP